MDQSTPFSVTSSNISTTSTIITSTPASSHSVIVDPSSSDEKPGASTSVLFSSIPTVSSDPQHTPKRVSSSTLSSPVLTPPTGKILSRNCNGTKNQTKKKVFEKFLCSVHVWAIKD
ncbi:CLUMA_CG006059, isoform A [Clunio marinus]|uniref:CLUMA_CG006059, isoform A n=1 Tax=Clunio marinus TaxID=568069 RepID=A0A1J1I0X4_9DIPT|nr:CLUMA_CG006059, isoform A [Clunio marinus]